MSTPDGITVSDDSTRQEKAAATGGIVGAVLVSTCCVFPLVLAGAGLGGAWVSNLVALRPYQPFFIIFSVAVLAYGFYLVYWRAPKECADDSCNLPLPSRFVKGALWLSMAAVAFSASFDYLVPLLSG